MSEVEVYSVNKLTFWAMDKNVVGKKKSRPGQQYNSLMELHKLQNNFHENTSSLFFYTQVCWG